MVGDKGRDQVCSGLQTLCDSTDSDVGCESALPLVSSKGIFQTECFMVL